MIFDFEDAIKINKLHYVVGDDVPRPCRRNGGAFGTIEKTAALACNCFESGYIEE